MTRFIAKVTVLAFAGLAGAAALSVTAFGSAGHKSETPSEPSGPLQAGEDCTNHGEACAQGTRCRVAQSGSKRFLCLPVANLGDACGPGTGGCQDPAFCDDSLHCALGHAALGSACARHVECKAPLVCPWAKRVCSEPAKIGQSCHTNPGGRSECQAGAGCNGIRCVAQKTDGTACLSDEECKAGNCQKGACGQAALPTLADRSVGD
jgi:hypothetical protein